MAVVDQRHVIGQRDEIIKADRSVVLERLDLPHVISLIEIESIILAVEYDLTVFIGLEDQFFDRLTVQRAEIEVRVFREDPESDAFKLLVGVISIDLDDFEGSDRTFAVVGVGVLFFAFVGLLISSYRNLVDDLLRSVAAHVSVVWDYGFRGVGYGKGRHRRSVGNAKFVFAAADRIGNADACGIGHDPDGTVVQTQVGAQHVLHLHRLTVIERCLGGVEGNPVLRGPGPVAQFSRVEQFLVESVIHDFIRVLSLMIRPDRFVNDVIFAAVCNGKFLKIDSILQLQIVVDPVVRIIHAVCLLRDRIGRDRNTVRRIRITDRCSVDLRPLRSSVDTHMFGVPGLTCIHLEQIPVKKVGKSERFLLKTFDGDRVFERTAVLGNHCFFQTRFCVNDRGGIRFPVEVDRVGMILFVSSRCVSCLQPLLVGLRRQPHIHVAAAGICLKAGQRFFCILIESYNDQARAVRHVVALSRKESGDNKRTLFEQIVVVAVVEIDARQIIRYDCVRETILRDRKGRVPRDLIGRIRYRFFVYVDLVFGRYVDRASVTVGGIV